MVGIAAPARWTWASGVKELFECAILEPVQEHKDSGEKQIWEEFIGPW